MRRFNFVGSEKARRKIADRYAAVAMVEAYEMMGWTQAAAALVAGIRFGVSPGTIKNWVRLVNGIALADRAERLRSLSWNDFEIVRDAHAR